MAKVHVLRGMSDAISTSDAGGARFSFETEDGEDLAIQIDNRDALNEIIFKLEAVRAQARARHLGPQGHGQAELEDVHTQFVILPDQGKVVLELSYRGGRNVAIPMTDEQVSTLMKSARAARDLLRAEMKKS